MDERIRKEAIYKTLLKRPDFASISGFLLVVFFFLLTAFDSGMFNLDGVINWTTVAAYLGIISVGASLLIISGEFDLSIGSMIGFAGIAFAVPTLYWGVPVEVSLVFSLIVCLSIGGLIGYLVVRTGLPSFIISLAFLFILRGLTLAFAILFTDKTIVSGMSEYINDSSIISFLFQGYFFESFFAWLASENIIATAFDGSPIALGIPKVIIWMIIVAVSGSFLLTKTQFGNWIFATGGDDVSAQNVGVPVKKVKISMFMVTALCAWLFAVLQVSEFGSASADRGLLKEFEAIIAAVIGGALLTGGYGSVIGAIFGALIFGIVQIGINYTDINSDWFRVFLGVMLLIAVLFNNYIRKLVTESK